MKQYLDLLKNIMENGVEKGDRTGTGTKSIFGTQMRFNLQEGFPLVTTKKIHMKSVIHELIWFLKGETNIKYLKDNGVKIWDEWADKNGDLGPVYGAQWRRWKSHKQETVLLSNGCETDWIKPKEIDQLKNVIERIKTNPECRRLIVTAWNPADLPDMALSPCHCFFQFWTRPLTLLERKYLNIPYGSISSCSSSSLEENEKSAHDQLDKYGLPKYALSCQLYQRSVDSGLGLPFNIASYALLTHMIAQVTNTVAGDFVWTGGDTHIYNDHIEPLKEQMKREPYPLPTIKLNPDIKDIDDFKFEDIELIGYKCHPHIKMPVAV